MDLPETPDTQRHRWWVGYASGAFDQLHVGHLRYLCAAAARCERLIVGMPSDDVVARAKGKAPLIPQAERLELVAAFACVAEALPVAVSMEDAEFSPPWPPAWGLMRPSSGPIGRTRRAGPVCVQSWKRWGSASSSCRALTAFPHPCSGRGWPARSKRRRDQATLAIPLPGVVDGGAGGQAGAGLSGVRPPASPGGGSGRPTAGGGDRGLASPVRLRSGQADAGFDLADPGLWRRGRARPGRRLGATPDNPEGRDGPRGLAPSSPPRSRPRLRRRNPARRRPGSESLARNAGRGDRLQSRRPGRQARGAGSVWPITSARLRKR
jgi:cytidyltransferase-like protein